MAEGRMLKRVISESKKLGKLKSDSARLLYTWLIPWLDVEGRHSADIEIIKGHIFPKVKSMSLRKISSLIDILNDAKLIILYSVNGENYLQFTKFNELQSIRRDRESDSKIPAPSKGSIITPGVIQEDATIREVNISKEKLNKHTPEKPSPKKTELEEEFEEFWEGYKAMGNSKNPIGDKGTAYKAFKALRKKIGKDELIKALWGEADYLKYERLVNNFDKRKKYASTWLRSDKWREHKDFKYTARL